MKKNSEMRPKVERFVQQSTMLTSILLAFSAHVAFGVDVSLPRFPAVSLVTRARDCTTGRIGSLIKMSRISLRGGGFTAPLPIAQDEGFIIPPTLDGQGMATLKFSIRYGLENGAVVVCGPNSKFGSNDPYRAPKMQKKGGDLWELSIQVPIEMEIVKYNYMILSGTIRKESQINERVLCLKGVPDGAHVEVQDMFRSPKAFSLATSCFSRAIFGRGFQVPGPTLLWSTTIRLDPFPPPCTARDLR